MKANKGILIGRIVTVLLALLIGFSVSRAVSAAGNRTDELDLASTKILGKQLHVETRLAEDYYYINMNKDAFQSLSYDEILETWEFCADIFGGHNFLYIIFEDETCLRFTYYRDHKFTYKYLDSNGYPQREIGGQYVALDEDDCFVLAYTGYNPMPKDDGRVPYGINGLVYRESYLRKIGKDPETASEKNTGKNNTKKQDAPTTSKSSASSSLLDMKLLCTTFPAGGNMTGEMIYDIDSEDNAGNRTRHVVYINKTTSGSEATYVLDKEYKCLEIGSLGVYSLDKNRTNYGWITIYDQDKNLLYESTHFTTGSMPEKNIKIDLHNVTQIVIRTGYEGRVHGKEALAFDEMKLIP